MAKNMAIKNFIAIFIIIIFSSCSSSKDFSKLKTIYELYKNPNLQKIDRKITWNDIKDINYPLIEVRTNGVLYRALMLPLSTRYGYSNYSSGSGQTLNLNGSLVTKTNGMNLGLLSVEISQNSPLISFSPINEWPSSESRKYTFLTPMFSEITTAYNCIFTIDKIEKKIILEKEYELQKVIENCKNTEHNFSNIYWIDKEGFIWISKQWIGKPNIYADIKVLKRE